MEPPSFVCKAIYDMHKRVRLAWHGPTETFALIQFMHETDVGRPGAESTAYEFWATTCRLREGRIISTVRIDRGPIFNRRGRTTPDWNWSGYHPIFIADLGEYHIDNYKVFGGGIIPIMRRWLAPLKKRLVESRVEAGRQLQSNAEDIAGEATDYLWSQANNSDAVSNTSATHVESAAETRAWERQKESAGELKDIHLKGAPSI